MRGYLRNSILFVSLYCVTFAAYADLPEAVTKRIAEQKDAFAAALTELTKGQHNLLLERYADLLPKSAGFLNMAIDKRELNDYLKQTFPAPEDKPRSPRDYYTEHNEVNVLLKNLKSDRSGYFESQDKIQLPFVCGGVEQLFVFTFIAKPSYLELQLRGVRIPDPDNLPGNCLRVKYDTDDAALEIAWLSSQNYACPIPPERGGECMLSVAEQLAKQLGASTILLQDSAKAACDLNDSDVSLTLLRTFQKDAGWYEFHGFNARTGEEEANARKAKLLNYTLDSLENSFKAHKNEEDDEVIVRQIFEKRIPEYRNKEKKDTAAAFMAWLWKKDCRDYVKLDAFFRYDSDHEFSKLYASPAKLIKQLKK